MDQLMSAFHGQLSSLYRNSVRDSSSGVISLAATRVSAPPHSGVRPRHAV